MTPRLSEIDDLLAEHARGDGSLDAQGGPKLVKIARALEADLAISRATHQATLADNARLTRELAECKKGHAIAIDEKAAFALDQVIGRAEQAEKERDAARASEDRAWAMAKDCEALAEKARDEADALRSALKNMKAFGTTANHLWFEARIDEALAPRRLEFHGTWDFGPVRDIVRPTGTAKATETKGGAASLVGGSTPVSGVQIPLAPPLPLKPAAASPEGPNEDAEVAAMIGQDLARAKKVLRDASVPPYRNDEAVRLANAVLVLWSHRAPPPEPEGWAIERVIFCSQCGHKITMVTMEFKNPTPACPTRGSSA